MSLTQFITIRHGLVISQSAGSGIGVSIISPSHDQSMSITMRHGLAISQSAGGGIGVSISDGTTLKFTARGVTSWAKAALNHLALSSNLEVAFKLGLYHSHTDPIDAYLHVPGGVDIKVDNQPGDADVGTLTFSHPSAEGSFSVQTGQGLTTRPSIASFDNTTLEHVSFITIRLRFIDGGIFINCDGNDVPLPGAFLRATDGIAFGWEHHSAHVAALMGEVHFREA
ncbi:hypothetical protein C8R45DRAFT_948278 [Mycena sanguinolenta]|nr:hypothetical protein C8R45DRAFT_948278 [Mycena sanguinolenta]